MGCIIGSKRHVDEEIHFRISKMCQNVGMKYRLLKDRHEPNEAKLLIHMTILRPILLYGHESWILTKKLKSKIAAAEVLRLVKGVTRRDRVQHAAIYEEFMIKPIIDTIQTDQIRWFGHVMRRDEKTTAKNVLDIKVKWKRPRGRHRISWLKYIDNILKVTGTNLKEVEDRGLQLNRIAWRKCLTD